VSPVYRQSAFIAGYTMTYRRAFKLGDRIRIGQTVGEVSEIRLLVTRLRTGKNEDVVIPNSTILSSEVVNYSTLARKDGLILHTAVGIGYEVPWRQVEAMLLLAAERTEGLMRDPMPFVLQTSLGDFAVTYELNAYCDDAGRMPRLYSALHRNIQDVFNEYGVQIMTPNYEADPEKPKLVPADQWYAAPAATDASAASPAAGRPESKGAWYDRSGPLPRRSDDLDLHPDKPPVDHAEFAGGLARQVDDATLPEGTAVVDRDDDALAIVQPGDPHSRAEGKGLVGRGVCALIEAFSAGRLPALEAVVVVGGDAGLARGRGGAALDHQRKEQQ
jgi:hypothetical protein